MTDEPFRDDHRPFDPSDAFPTTDQTFDDIRASPLTENDTFFDDPALADGTHVRRGLEHLLEEVEAGRFDVCVVWEVPRLLRTELTREQLGQLRGLFSGSAQALSCGDDTAVPDAGAHDGGVS